MLRNRKDEIWLRFETSNLKLIPLIRFSAELQRIGETIETVAYD
jgi:hypothetical protein